MMKYNIPGSPWSKAKGPPMPEVVSTVGDIPVEILEQLEELFAAADFKPAMLAGPVLRLMQQIQTLFGPVDILTMWKGSDEHGWSTLSPQAVICIPPAQAVLTLVNMNTDPRFMLIRRTRDLAVNSKYVMPFWLKGLTPSLYALLKYAGIETTEFPRGALADGKGFKAPQEAEEELGLKTQYFIKASPANPDPGQMAFALPHMIAIMSGEKLMIDEREAASFKGYILVKPEDLFNALQETVDGVTLSQVVTFINQVTYGQLQGYDSKGEEITLDDTKKAALKRVAARVLLGPLARLTEKTPA